MFIDAVDTKVVKVLLDKAALEIRQDEHGVHVFAYRTDERREPVRPNGFVLGRNSMSFDKGA